MPAAARITVLLDEPPIGVIRPQLYGQFAEHLGACVDGGLWVGEDSPVPNLGGLRSDVLEALRNLRVPLLRWPGGCYADDYHWEDGVGPRRERPRRVNLWWGHGVETNQFGTHEFLRLCQFLGAEPYLAGNLGSGSPREMREWMEYCNFAGDSTLARRRGGNGSPGPFGVRYWGVGNEAWGCGGNFCPEDYAREYKRYATYLTGFGTEPYLIAVGPDGNKPDWTRRFFTKFFSTPDHFNRRLDGFAAHYYCGTAGPSATEYDTNQWYELLYKATLIEPLILEQRAVMDEFDPQRRVGLIIDEWGTWHLPTPGAPKLWQQNTLRDALAAAITLDAFHRQADKVVMANIAQVVNVLQAMILTEPASEGGGGGGRMVLTPTYHVFDLYQPHQGGRAVRTAFEAPPVAFALGDRRQTMPGLLGSASVRAGVLTLSVVNPHATFPATAAVDLRGGSVRSLAGASVLRHDELTAHNTFDEPDALRPGPADVAEPGGDGEWHHVFPPSSVTVLRVVLG